MRAILGKGLALTLLFTLGTPMWWIMFAAFTLLLLPYGYDRSLFANFGIYVVVTIVWWAVLPALAIKHNHETAK